MKTLLLAFTLCLPALADPSLRTLIDPGHAGTYECVCTDPKCGSQNRERARVAIDANEPFITVQYSDETHSGIPARIVDRETQSVLYKLASGGNVGFDAQGVIRFGRGDLWTCVKQ